MLTLQEPFGEYPIMCDRQLRAAVLDFAIRDLEEGNLREIQNALRWFYATPCNDPELFCITYEEVLECLELSAVRKQKIEDSIASGIQRCTMYHSLKTGERGMRSFFVIKPNYSYRDAEGILHTRYKHKRHVSSV